MSNNIEPTTARKTAFRYLSVLMGFFDTIGCSVSFDCISSRLFLGGNDDTICPVYPAFAKQNPPSLSIDAAPF
jgi:hypothetical protein